MKDFRFKDTVLLTGLSANVLLIWAEREANAGTAKGSGRKRYSLQELKRLLVAAFLHHNGRTTTELETLSIKEINIAAGLIQPGEGNYKSFVQLMMMAGLTYDEGMFINTLNSLSSAIGFEKTIAEVCHQYLIIVQKIWGDKKDNATPAYFSKHLIRNRLIAETEKYNTALTGNPEVVLLSRDMNNNDLPILYINYLLRKYGRDVLFPAPGVSIESIAVVARLASVKTLYLHIGADNNTMEVDEYMANVRKMFPGKTIVASGEGIVAIQRSFTNFIVLKSDAEIYSYITKC